MFATFGQDYEETEEAKRTKDEVIYKLTNNEWFNHLPEKQQAHFLKGKNAFFKSQDEIISSSGGEIPDFSIFLHLIILIHFLWGFTEWQMVIEGVA